SIFRSRDLKSHSAIYFLLANGAYSNRVKKNFLFNQILLLILIFFFFEFNIFRNLFHIITHFLLLKKKKNKIMIITQLIIKKLKKLVVKKTEKIVICFSKNCSKKNS